MSESLNAMSIANDLFNAMKMVSDNSIQQLAQFDKTIAATVMTCEDEVAGKYKVRYQDAVYYATANNTEITYSTGTAVYVLIPEGDFSKPKKIIGTVKDHGEAYLEELQRISAEKAYEPIGGNGIQVKEEYSNGFSICSYKPEIKILYDKNDIANSKFTIDEVGFQDILKQVSHLQIVAKVKTTLPREQQNKGNFGLIIALDFEAEDNQIITKKYILDVSNMQGTVYTLSNFLTQNIFFPIDGTKYQCVNSIAIFTEGFNVRDNQSDDIFFDDIAIYGMIKNDDKNWNTYYLKFDFPAGDTLSSEKTQLIVNASTIFKNKTVPNDNVKYYWFLKQSNVDSNNRYYCAYGGQGWKCLNTIQYKETSAVENSELYREWVPGSHQFTVAANDLAASQAEYKCVIVTQDNLTFSRNFTLYNSQASYNLTISSSLGAHIDFMQDRGVADLTCHIAKDNVELNVEDYNFYWGKTDLLGAYQLLDADNGGSMAMFTGYTNKQVIELINQILIFTQDSFDNETLLETADIKLSTYKDIVSAQLLTSLIKAAAPTLSGENGSCTYKELYQHLTNYLASNQLSYIHQNVFYNLYAKTIDTVANYSCSVFRKNADQSDGAYIGTASIQIKNIITNNAKYTLRLINDNQVFKYSTQGLSPTHPRDDTPQLIQPLGFEIYDSKGYKIEDAVKESDRVKIQWKMPIVDTLLTANQQVEPIETAEEYVIYNTQDCVFAIADTYKAKTLNNNIELTVEFDGEILYAITNFNFIKEGNAGTNGTDYFCRIVPNYTIKNQNGYPTIFCTKYSNGNIVVTSNFLEPNIDCQNQRWFKVELYNNGNKIVPDGSQQITWKILETEKTTEQLLPVLTLMNEQKQSEESPLCTLDISQFNTLFTNTNGYRPCLVMQVKYQYNNATYYATIPIALSLIDLTNASDTDIYKITMKPQTGFNEAMYTSQGNRPTYAAQAPFEVQISANLEGKEQDITNKTKTGYGAPYAYTWEVYNGENTNFVIVRQEEDLIPYQYNVSAPRTYSGYDINNGIKCTVTKSDNAVLGVLYFPVNMYLNRFEQAHLNDWDGNSIKISDDDKDGYILAPQVGAGHKDTNNAFTGMLMGDVKTGEIEETGLFGYNTGIRTLFLNAEDGSAYFGPDKEISLEPAGVDTKVKLGVWNLDKEAIWRGVNDLAKKGEDNIYLGTKGFSLSNLLSFNSSDSSFIVGPWNVDTTAIWKGNGFNSDVDEEFKNIYLGDKGVSLGKLFVFKSENSTFTIGPWTVTNDAFYRNSSNLGAKGNQNIYLGTAGFSLSDRLVFQTSTGDLSIKGNLTAEGGKIGNWFINKGALTSVENDTLAGTSGIYLGTDGLRFGDNKLKFITEDGSLSVSGALTAGAGSKIGGWYIDSTALSSETGIDLDDTSGIYLGTDGLRFGNNALKFTANSGELSVNGAITASSLSLTGTHPFSTVAFDGKYSSLTELSRIEAYLDANGKLNVSHAGGGYKFSFDAQGLLTAENAVVSGKLVASSGAIGNWQIIGSSLWGYKDKKVSVIRPPETSSWVLALGATIGENKLENLTDDNLKTAPFRVNRDGILYASGAEIGGTLTAGAGSKIGTWFLGSNALTSVQNDTLAGTSGIYLGTDGVRFGNAFKFNNGNVSTFNLGTALTYNGTDLTITAKSISIGTSTAATTGDVGTAKQEAIDTAAANVINSINLATSGTITLQAGVGIKLATTSQLQIDAGNFKLDSSGNVTAAGILTAQAGSKIGNWTIGSNTIHSNNGTGDNDITLNCSGTTPAIYSGSKTALSKTTINGFYLGADGLAIGSGFSVTNTGTANLTGATFKNGNLTLEGGDDSTLTIVDTTDIGEISDTEGETGGGATEGDESEGSTAEGDPSTQEPNTDSKVRIYRYKTDADGAIVKDDKGNSQQEALLLYPNRLYFRDSRGLTRKADNDNEYPYDYTAGSIYFIPSAKADYNGGVTLDDKGKNTLYFTRPIGLGKGNFIRGYRGVPIIAQGTSVQQRCVRFGPRAEYSEIIPRTIMRGHRTEIWAFGDEGVTNAKGKGIISLHGKQVNFNGAKWKESSDERIKNIYSLPKNYYQFFKDLQPISYTFIDGEANDIRLGYSAQAVEHALIKNNMPVNLFVSKDINEEYPEIEDFYSLNYGEFNTLYAAVLQDAIKEVETLKEENRQLKDEIQKIKEYLSLA